MLNVVCFSHTLDNVGSLLDIFAILEFGNLWLQLFSHSLKAKLAWQTLTDHKPKSYSETCWWSKWEVFKQLLEMLSDFYRRLRYIESLRVLYHSFKLFSWIQSTLSISSLSWLSP